MIQRLFFVFLPWLILAVLLGLTPQLPMVRPTISLAILALLILNGRDLQKRSCFTWGTLLVLVLVGVKPTAFVYLNLALPCLLALSAVVRQPVVHRDLDGIWVLVLILQAGGVAWQGVGFFIPSFVCVLCLLSLSLKIPDYRVGQRFWKTVQALPPVNSPYLRGNFTPVRTELTCDDLMIEGLVPVELNGTYVRIGPNPFFTPYTYAYPEDGDGMVHAMILEHGWVQYKNRWVNTADLKKENEAGKALFSGKPLSLLPDPKYFPRSDRERTYKEAASVQIIPLGPRWLALSGQGASYWMDENLETQSVAFPDGYGPMRLKGGKAYGLSSKGIFILDQAGVCVRVIKVKDWDPVQTDFLVTDHWIVLWRAAPFQGITMIHLEKESEVNMLCDKPVSLELINAFELGEHLKMHYLAQNEIVEMTLQPVEGTLHREALYQGEIAFPVYRLDRTGTPYRFLYFLEQQRCRSIGAFDCLVKFDLLTREPYFLMIQAGLQLSEPTFVPKEGEEDEDQGYLLLFAFERALLKSQFLIMDAKVVPSPALASIKLPCRVPFGLHGAWQFKKERGQGSCVTQ